MARANKQSTTKGDPVFAAIEKHRNAIAAQLALSHEWHAVYSTWTWERNPVRAIGDIPHELLDRMDAASDAELRARQDLIEAKPTTRAGERARDDHLKANTREIQADGYRVWPPGSVQ